MTTTTSTSRRSSSNPRRVVRPGRCVVQCSVRADGDFHLTSQPRHLLERRRRGLIDLPWTMADQRHGTGVVRVRNPGDGDGATGDVIVTGLVDAVIAVWAADCAPIVLLGATRQIAVVHAGWRGLAAGVVDRAVAACGEPIVEALLGPAIGACCYEFGADDLAAVARGVHADTSQLTGRTTAGETSLDVPAAVRSAVGRHRIPLTVLEGCTGCTYDGFSHRVRREPQRHVVAAWRPREDA